MKRIFILTIVFFILLGCATPPPPKKATETVFYPPLPQQPRLQFLTSISNENDLGKAQSGLDAFLFGPPPTKKAIGKPYDLGSVKGKIYILDRIPRKLLIIDLAKKEFDHLKDKRMGRLDDPSGIWISYDDIKYIADMKRKQVVAFGPDNEFLKIYGDKTLFDKPVDVAVFENNVYVCDMSKSRIFVLDKNSGKHIKTIGGTGIEKGSLHKPTHIVVDQNGNLYVNDAFNFRVQVFDPNGTFIKSIGFLGDTHGAFARPKGLQIDREGHLYVADAAFENVQIFDENSGQLLLYFGGAGYGPGNMYLPSGVHIDYDNVEFFQDFVDKEFKLKYLLYVTNSFGSNKLNIYGYGDWIGQPLTAFESAGKSETVEETESEPDVAVQSTDEVSSSEDKEQDSSTSEKTVQKPLPEVNKKDVTAAETTVEGQKDVLDKEAAKLPSKDKAAPETDIKVVLNPAGGSVREKPALDAKEKFRLNKGDSVSVIISRNDWNLVEFESGQVGWAHQSLFQDMYNASESQNAISNKETPGEKAVIKVNIGRVRAKPSASAQIKFKLIKGAAPKVIGTQGDWYQVELEDGRQGWAHKSLFQE